MITTAVVGGGVVGLATALALLEADPGASLEIGRVIAGRVAG